MNRQKLSFILVSLVFVSSFCFAITVLPENARATTLFVGGGGPSNYTTIQMAVADAQPGDTIYIYSGTYSGQVKINKTVSLVGENRDTTSITATTSNGTVRIEANWVNISELTINGFGMGFETGLILHSAHNCTIKDNDINGETGFAITNSNDNRIINNSIYGYYGALGIGSSHNNYFFNNSVYGMKSYGIMMSYSNNTVFINNEIHNSSSGMTIFGSRNASITYNRILNNTYQGLRIEHSSYFKITDNILDGGGIYMEGDSLEHWNTHIIEPSNTINGRPVIYWKNVTGGTVVTDSGEVILANCTGVEVKNQMVNQGDVGVLLGFSNENIISNNNVSKVWWRTASTTYGIML
ncbi:MAG: right-handed parallel beta-helix repeat-containing protein, partial [Methanobacteriota archaeon]